MKWPHALSLAHDIMWFKAQAQITCPERIIVLNQYLFGLIGDCDVGFNGAHASSLSSTDGKHRSRRVCYWWLCRKTLTDKWFHRISSSRFSFPRMCEAVHGLEQLGEPHRHQQGLVSAGHGAGVQLWPWLPARGTHIPHLHRAGTLVLRTSPLHPQWWSVFLSSDQNTTTAVRTTSLLF